MNDNVNHQQNCASGRFSYLPLKSYTRKHYDSRNEKLLSTYSKEIYLVTSAVFHSPNYGQEAILFNSSKENTGLSHTGHLLQHYS